MPKQITDWIGLWFEIEKERGVSDKISYRVQDLEGNQEEFSFSHAKADAHAALQNIFTRKKISAAQKSQLFSMIEQGPLAQGYMDKLPPNSPDLNPIEGLWKKIKAKGTHLVYFESFNKLMDTMTATANWFAKRPDEVLPLFGSYA